MSATSTAVARRTRPKPSAGFVRLAVGAIGIVFGDIGTSPIYAFQEIFAGPHDVGLAEQRVLGAVSMIFWTLTLVVSVKYVMIVMRASNRGEGGIMALTALITRLKLSPKALSVLAMLGVFGAALFYGDGMITPAVSVLSAVEGMEVAAKGMSDYVVPVAIVILVGLFGAQRFGTHKVGAAFGPVMIVWFVVIAILGLASIVQSPEVLVAVSPIHAFRLIAAEPLVAFLSLGSVVLCVTGAEALYADMGHFGARPIRLSWFVIATPALYLNYFGQGALVLRNPAAADDTFFLMVPHALIWPMVLLATVATVIASQAVISGAFSMTEQAIRLHYLPRMTVKHTSAEQRGQIYVPMVNWLLCACVVGLVIGFQDSSRLASAYGIAVTGTFVITTILITVVAHKQWHTPLWILVPVSAFFYFIDMSFFLANLTKFVDGGWFPLLIAAILFLVFMTWSRGLKMLRAKFAALTMSEPEFCAYLASGDVPVVPGTAVFITANTRIPVPLVEYLRRGGPMRTETLHVALLVQTVPTVPAAEQVSFIEVAPHLTRVEVRYGFMQTPDALAILQAARDQGFVLDRAHTLIVFHSTRVIVTKAHDGMSRWRKALFAFMLRVGAPPAAVASIPPHLMMEWTSLVAL